MMESIKPVCPSEADEVRLPVRWTTSLQMVQHFADHRVEMQSSHGLSVTEDCKKFTVWDSEWKHTCVC